MNDNLKNIISNILGLLVFIFSIYSLVYQDLSIASFTILTVIGLSLFLFKSSRFREFLAKYINKKLED